jgi:hypothetical protein
MHILIINANLKKHALVKSNSIQSTADHDIPSFIKK